QRGTMVGRGHPDVVVGRRDSLYERRLVGLARFHHPAVGWEDLLGINKRKSPELLHSAMTLGAPLGENRPNVFVKFHALGYRRFLANRQRYNREPNGQRRRAATKRPSSRGARLRWPRACRLVAGRNRTHNTTPQSESEGC